MAFTRDGDLYRATGAGVMDESLTVPTGNKGHGILRSVKLHLSASGGAAENFTVKINSGTAAAYDTLLVSQDMNTETDVVQVYGPGELAIDGADTIDFDYANTNSRTWGIEVHVETPGA